IGDGVSGLLALDDDDVIRGLDLLLSIQRGKAFWFAPPPALRVASKLPKTLLAGCLLDPCDDEIYRAGGVVVFEDFREHAFSPVTLQSRLDAGKCLWNFVYTRAILRPVPV